MDDPGRSRREVVEKLGLAAVGAVALTAERMDELASELAAKGGLRRDEARQIIEDAVTRWRGDASRFAERASSSVQALLAQAGLVSRDEFDELELRLAQVEHRLRLLEADGEPRSSSVQD